MNLEEFFNQHNVIDLSFFNFRNAITACYFADRDLRILKINDNFSTFFPVLGNVTERLFSRRAGAARRSRRPDRRFGLRHQGQGHMSSFPRIHCASTARNGSFRCCRPRPRMTSFPISTASRASSSTAPRNGSCEGARGASRAEDTRPGDDRGKETASCRHLANAARQISVAADLQIASSPTRRAAERLARKNLTIFFSDIEDFTELSDGMEPERLDV